MVGFLRPCLLSLRKGCFVKKKVYPLYLIHNLRSVNCVGAIRIFSCGSRRTGQAVIRNDFSFGSHKISSVFNSVQFVDRYLVEVYHISDYMIGTLLFLKKKAATRNAVLQRDGSHTHRTVVINQCRLLCLKLMKKDFIGQCFAKERE